MLDDPQGLISKARSPLLEFRTGRRSARPQPDGVISDVSLGEIAECGSVTLCGAYICAQRVGARTIVRRGKVPRERPRAHVRGKEQYRQGNEPTPGGPATRVTSRELVRSSLCLSGRGNIPDLLAITSRVQTLLRVYSDHKNHSHIAIGAAKGLRVGECDMNTSLITI